MPRIGNNNEKCKQLTYFEELTGQENSMCIGDWRKRKTAQ